MHSITLYIRLGKYQLCISEIRRYPHIGVMVGVLAKALLYHPWALMLIVGYILSILQKMKLRLIEFKCFLKIIQLVNGGGLTQN